MFGINAVLIIVVITLMICFKHGAIKFGQIMAGVITGMLLTNILPGSAPALATLANQLFNAIVNIKWG